MAIKTFTTGEILTASDTNTYLANSGLVYVTQVSPTASTAVQIPSCFSSTYNNYKVIVTPISVVSASDVRLKLLVGTTPTSTGYYMTNIFASGGSISSSSENAQTSFRGVYCGTGGTGTGPFNFLEFDIYGVFATTPTRYRMQSSAWDGTNTVNRSATGFHDGSTSFNGLELSAGSNITCTVSIYGYRKS